jgi:4-aminobutyrate aminotransferase-like enzyme
LPRRWAQDHLEIVDVRGRGLMIGVEFGGRGGRGCAPAKGVSSELVRAAAAEDLLLMPSGARECIRILPPLVLTAGEAQEALERLGRVLQRVLRK